MKKLSIIVIMFGLLFTGVISTASAAPKFSLEIDGKGIEITGPSPFIDSSNRLQLPISLVQRALKVKLVWENERKEATFYVPKEFRSSSYADSWLGFKVGRLYYVLDYEKYPMDTAPINKNGSIYVPAVYIGQVFNYIIKYDKSTGLITMNDNRLSEYVETETLTYNSPYALEEENIYDLKGASPGGSTIDLTKQHYLSMEKNVSEKIEAQVYMDLSSSTAEEQVNELYALLDRKFDVKTLIESVIVCDSDPAYAWNFIGSYGSKKTQYFTVATLRGNKKSLLFRVYNPGAVPASLMDFKFDPSKSNKVIERGVLSFNPHYVTMAELEAVAISHSPLVLDSTADSSLQGASLQPLMIEVLNTYGLYYSDPKAGVAKFKEIVSKYVSPIGSYREDSIREFSSPEIGDLNGLSKAELDEIAATLKGLNRESTFMNIGNSGIPGDEQYFGLIFNIESPVKYPFFVEFGFTKINGKMTLTKINVQTGERMSLIHFVQ